MKNISVAIAAFNEEKNIERCLKSVAGWTKEIVVVDGSSKDNTRQLAKNFGARVIQANNPEIFHINKQKAVNACSGDWILQLDADEIVSNELKKEIQKLLNPKFGNSAIRKTSHNFAGYYIPRKNYFLGRWLKKGGVYPDYVIRFFQKNKGRFPAKSIHEQIEITGKAGYLKNAILHYPYENLADYLRKAKIYTSLTAKELKEKNEKRNVLNMIKYLIIFPVRTFSGIYFRHLGFLDGVRGFLWAFFSALHHPAAFLKYFKGIT